MLNSDNQQSDESDFESEKCNSFQLWSGTIKILLPVAALALIWGRRGLLTKFLLQFDKNCISVICPSLKEKQKLLQWIERYLPTTWFHIQNSSLGKADNFWKDGSLLCSLINSFIPGACSNPGSHRHRPPSHGQALAYKYLGIAPVFTEHDLKQNILNAKQEQDLNNYLQQIRESCKKEATSNSKFSSNYIAKGMGLVSGEANRKMCFYIYVNSFDSFNANDIIINIQAPNAIYETLSIPSSCIKRKLFPHLFSNSFKYRSQSERLFLKPISNLTSQTTTKIPMQFLIEKDRVKVEYIPRSTGIYKVSIITNGSHILGSPFPVSISENSIGACENFEEINPLPTVTIKKTIKKTIVSQAIDFFDHEQLNKTFESNGIDYLIDTNYEILNSDLESNSTSPICKDHIEHEVSNNQQTSLIPCRNPEKTTHNVAYNNKLTNESVDYKDEIAKENNLQFKIGYASENDLNILNYLPQLKYDRSVSCHELNNDSPSHRQTSESLGDNTDYYLKFQDKLSFWESMSSISSIKSSLKQGVSLPDLILVSNATTAFDFYDKHTFKSKQQYWKFLSSQTIDCIETTSHNGLSNTAFSSSDFKNKFRERQEFWERLTSQDCLKERFITQNAPRKLDSTLSCRETNVDLLKQYNSQIDVQTIDYTVFKKRQHFWENMNVTNVQQTQEDKNIQKKVAPLLETNRKEDSEKTFSNYFEKGTLVFNELNIQDRDRNLTDDFKSINTATEAIRMRFHKNKFFFKSLESRI